MSVFLCAHNPDKHELQENARCECHICVLGTLGVKSQTAAAPKLDCSAVPMITICTMQEFKVAKNPSERNCIITLWKYQEIVTSCVGPAPPLSPHSAGESGRNLWVSPEVPATFDSALYQRKSTKLVKSQPPAATRLHF